MNKLKMLADMQDLLEFIRVENDTLQPEKIEDDFLKYTHNIGGKTMLETVINTIESGEWD